MPSGRALATLAVAFGLLALAADPGIGQTGKGKSGAKGTANSGEKTESAKGDSDADSKSGGEKGDAPRDTKSKKPAKKGEREAASGPVEYSSKNFRVYTDMPADDAKDLLQRLETMLTVMSKYWGRPNRQTIEVYVVKDINKWPAGSLPAEAADSVRSGGGITLGRVSSIGGNVIAAKAPAYAVADRGTPQHEAVHAYCMLNFGKTGPVWYAEGMAEFGQYFREGEKAVNCHEVVSEYIRNSKPKSLDEIVNSDETTGDSWQNYAWRWALCHLLSINDNYAPRFRPLGLDLLTKQTSSFNEVYGPMAKEISFEYDFFVRHVDKGFRCDLCSWDWKTKSKLVKGTVSSLATIEAGRGWQPTRASVEDGKVYQFSAAGNWKTSKDAAETDADGDSDGKGKLLGILFDDYKLSEPFELGAYGTFTAPEDGQLFVRCQDDWTALADNSGKLTVKIMADGNGRTLPNPKDRVKGGGKNPDGPASPKGKDE